MIKNLAIGGSSNRMLLIAALILGLLAALLVGVYLSNLDSDSGGSDGGVSTTTVPVVVAAQAIPPQTVVTVEMLAVKQVPIDLAVVGALTKTEDVVGQTTSVALAIGEQIPPTKVTSVTTAQGTYGLNTPASLVVPAGKRAITVVIGPVAAAGGLVRPGDHVDLIRNKAVDVATTDAPVEGTDIAAACFVLQDVEVLSIDTTLALQNASTNTDALAAGPVSGASKLMVIAVSPSDAALIAAAQEQPGDTSVQTPLWAALRPFGEHGVVQGLPTCTNLQAAPTS